MRVIKDKKILEDDWTLVREVLTDEEVQQGKVIVPLAYWKEHRDVLLDLNDKHAVWIDGDTDTEELAEDLSHFDLIALDFPAFKDGRSYSHARLLRQRYNYQGDLRAIGDVLQDQLFYMLRCGFDSFQLRDDKDAEAALKGFETFTVRYQAAADDAVPIYKLR
jgi:uncharacterized protein (DUF934 family)